MVRVIGESQVNGNASPTSSPVLGRRSTAVAAAAATATAATTAATTARSLSAHLPTVSKSIDSNSSLGNLLFIMFFFYLSVCNRFVPGH